MDLSWIDVTDMRVVGGILAVLAAVYLILDAYVSRTRDGEPPPFRRPGAPSCLAAPWARRPTTLDCVPAPYLWPAGWIGFWLEFRCVWRRQPACCP